MDAEMASLREFDVFVETTIRKMEDSGIIIPLKWVQQWKGADVKARLVANGFVQHGLDPDSTYASTPALSIAKVLLSLAASHQWDVRLGDVSTAFLHAELPDDEMVYVHPPPEYYSDSDAIWKLRKALYGLKSSPRHWQDQFADVLTRLGATRLSRTPTFTT